MSLLWASISTDLAARLIPVLAHSLWQSSLAACVLWITLRTVPARFADMRYLASVAALASVLVAAGVTWSLSTPQASDVQEIQMQTAEVNHSSTQPASVSTSSDHSESGTSPVTSPVNPLGSLLAPRTIIAAWFIGVCLMLLRMARALHGARRLTAQASPAPAAIHDLLVEVCQSFGIRRRIRVAVSTELKTPGIVGIVWVTLLIPASMATGAPSEALRAVIVHELIHVRRYDYALNLCQMVVESLFFFNPAVWWLSRRVRIEREACVDSAVVAVTGAPLNYAALLASVADRTTPNLTAVALTPKRGDGSLLERVRRILDPNVPPRITLPWGTLCAWLFVSMFAVLAIWQGTATAVTLAQELMSDEERVRAIVQARKQVDTPNPDVAEGQGTISGTIRTADGKPLSKKVWLYSMVKHPNSTHMGTIGDFDTKFEAKVGTGEAWLLALGEGYAPIYVGPFHVTPDAKIENVEIVLPVGFPVTVRITDGQGQPVPDAKLQAALVKEGGSTGIGNPLTTDENGIANIEHVTAELYRISLSRAGYQPLSTTTTFTQNQSSEFEMHRARPFVGQVLSTDGAPVADAKIRNVFEMRPQHGHDHGNSGAPITATDEEGRFVLDELIDGTKYVLLIENPAFGRVIMDGVEPGGALTAKFGPKLTVKGHLKGPLNSLQRNGKQTVVNITQIAKYSGAGHTSHLQDRVPVTIQDGVATFESSNLFAGEVRVKAGEHEVTTAVSAEQPAADVEIDLSQPIPAAAQPQTRQVVFSFAHDSQPIVPQGRVSVSTQSSVKELPITDGKVMIDVKAPGHVYCRPVEIAGWYFDDVNEQVAAAEEPLEIEVSVFPAGAIQGQVVIPTEFTAWSKPSITVMAVWMTRDPDRGHKIQRSTNITATLDRDGRYLASPIPLGSECSVRLVLGHNVQVSGPIFVTEEDPIQQADLELPAPYEATVEVVDPEGQPVANLPLSLRWQHTFRDGHASSGNTWANALATDQDGRVVVRDVNADVPQYYIQVDSRMTWQPNMTPLDVDGEVTRVELEPGEVLTGVVLDQETGLPVPDAEVYAMRRPVSTKRFTPSLFEAESRTNASGEFRFSNLPPESIQLGVREANLPAEPPSLMPGADTETELTITIPEWSRLKPNDKEAAKP